MASNPRHNATALHPREPLPDEERWLSRENINRGEYHMATIRPKLAAGADSTAAEPLPEWMADTDQTLFGHERDRASFVETFARLSS
jgi:hypothetical protein